MWRTTIRHDAIGGEGNLGERTWETQRAPLVTTGQDVVEVGFYDETIPTDSPRGRLVEVITMRLDGLGFVWSEERIDTG